MAATGRRPLRSCNVAECDVRRTQTDRQTDRQTSPSDHSFTVEAPTTCLSTT